MQHRPGNYVPGAFSIRSLLGYDADMSGKHSRSGKKYGGGHTTLIPLAALACDTIDRHPAVTKIAPGFIAAGLTTVRGKRRIKITFRTGGILLSVRDNATRQQVHVYTSDPDAVVRAITEGLKKEHVEVGFEKE